MEAKVYFDLSCSTELPKGAGWKRSRKDARASLSEEQMAGGLFVNSQEKLVWPLVSEQSFP